MISEIELYNLKCYRDKLILNNKYSDLGLILDNILESIRDNGENTYKISDFKSIEELDKLIREKYSSNGTLDCLDAEAVYMQCLWEEWCPADGWSTRMIFHFAHKAAKLGSLEARMKVALCYLKGEGIEQDEKGGMELITELANEGYPYARYMLGIINENVFRKNQDSNEFENVTKNYLEVAKLEYAPALFKIAQYHEGNTKLSKANDVSNSLDNLNVDMIFAWKFYYLAAVKGYGPAEKMFKEMDKYLLELCTYNASMDDDPDAWFCLGEHYTAKFKGYSLFDEFSLEKQKSLSAINAYTKSAIKGHAVGQYELAKCYEDGIGTNKDLKKASELYCVSATSPYNPILIKRAIYDGNKIWIETHFKNNIKDIDLFLKPRTPFNVSKTFRRLENELVRFGKQTPLFIATHLRELEVVQALLKLGSNPNIVGNRGTPLHELCSKEPYNVIKINVEIAKLLILHKSNLEPTIEHESPGMISLGQTYSMKYSMGGSDRMREMPQLFKTLLESGLDVFMPEKCNDSMISDCNIISYLPHLRHGEVRDSLLENVKSRSKKEIIYKGCTRKYENELSEFLLRAIDIKISSRNKELRSCKGMIREGFYDVEKINTMISEGFCITQKQYDSVDDFKCKIISILFREVYLPVKNEVLDFQRRIAFLSGFHSRLGEKSSVSSPAFKRNVLFSRDPVKLILKFSKDKPLKSDVSKEESNSSKTKEFYLNLLNSKK